MTCLQVDFSMRMLIYVSVRFLISFLQMCRAEAAGTHHSTAFSREEQLDEGGDAA